MSQTGPYRPSFFCRIFLLILLGGFFMATPSYSQKKEESKMEKLNKSKNKKNRNLRRRGDKGERNDRQRRAVRAKTRSNQGDRPYKGDITGRKLKSKISPRRPSFANYAQPSPYAGRKRNSEASRAKAAARYRQRNAPVSVTRRGERPYRTSLSGKRIRTRNTTSSRPGVYSQTNPYMGKKRITETRTARRASKTFSRPVSASGTNRRTYNRPPTYLGTKRRTENDVSRTAARLRKRPSSATRQGENPRRTSANGKRITTPRTVSSQGRTVTRPVNTYTGKRRRTEEDASRSAVRLRKRANSATRTGERSTNRTVQGNLAAPRSNSGSGRRVYERPNIYAGKKRLSEGTSANRNARRFSAPSSLSARTDPPNKKKRIVPRTASNPFRTNKRKSPYGATRRIREWEKGYATDITGRKFRSKSPSVLPPPRRPPFNPYHGRKRVGDKPYSGRFQGGYQSVSRSTKGPGRRSPYSGRSLSVTDKYKKPGRFTGRGSMSITRSSEQGQRRPAYSGGRNLSVTDKFKKPGRLTGRGSMSITRSSEQGKRRPAYSGGRNLSVTDKYKKPGRFTGRGSMSITRSSEQGKRRPAYSGGRNLSVTDKYKKPGRFTGRGSMSITRNAEDVGRRNRYTGGRNLSVTDKFKKPGKMVGRGGLSITRNAEDVGRRDKYSGGRNLSVTDKFKKPGKMVGRGGLSITKSAEDGIRRPRYSGGRNLSITGKFVGRTQKANPVKSVSTKWNNKGNPLAPTIYKNSGIVSNFQGRKKAEKPLKGGGSQSRDNWNNRGRPLVPLSPGKQTLNATNYVGNMKAEKPLKGGGSISGTGWNNKGKPLNPRLPGKNILNATSFSGTMKARKPITGSGGSISGSGWNNKGKPLDVQDISPQIFDGTRFRGRFKRSYFETEVNKDYGRYSGFFKEKNMKPEINDDYRNYSGTIKVTRRTAKDYHPSFYMHRDREADSMDQKNRKLSIKLLWAKVFRSNNPAKARKRPPELQFDEREQGLWYR